MTDILLIKKQDFQDYKNILYKIKKNFGLFIRNIASDIIKKNISLALEKIRQYFGKNPYDMFDFLMDL